MRDLASLEFRVLNSTLPFGKWKPTRYGYTAWKQARTKKLMQTCMLLVALHVQVRDDDYRRRAACFGAAVHEL